MLNNKYLTQIEEKLDLYFGKKAPAMPENIKELIVKYSPYIAIIVLIMMIPSLLLVFGISSIFIPFAYFGGGYRPFFPISSIFLFVATLLEISAIPGLFNRTKKSWQLMFLASLVTMVSYFFDLNIPLLIINSAISFYILFQIKSYYKN